MSRNAEDITTVDGIWGKIDMETKQDWVIAQASKDPTVRETMEVLGQYRGLDEASQQVCRDALEDYLVANYPDMPRERSAEVFEIAELAAVWELESDGKA